jgi:hypothetical protein
MQGACASSARSTDDGATWSSRVQVNDDASGSSSTTTQFHPRLQVDQTDGTVIIGWHDTRNYSSNNRRMEVYLARSTNCGVSWETNIKVAQNSAEFNNSTISYTDENSTDNTNYNPNQYGEYLGLDAHNRIAYAAWCDSRQFYPNSTSNTQMENVGYASVTFCSPPTGLSAPTATPACNGPNPKVDLSWSAPSWGTNATGGTYAVERANGPSCNTYSTVMSGLSVTTYSDTSVSASTPYCYRITATNNCPGTVLTPMSATSSSTSVTTGTCAAATPPPVADGWPGHAGGNAATFTKSGSSIIATWDAATCTSGNALILYGNIGTWTGYAGSADCSGGTSGTKTFTPPAGTAIWFNIVWESGTTAGHPGYATSGARTWTTSSCSVTANNATHGTCP